MLQKDIQYGDSFRDTYPLLMFHIIRGLRFVYVQLNSVTATISCKDCLIHGPDGILASKQAHGRAYLLTVRSLLIGPQATWAYQHRYP